jgi:hypothetical protein
MFSEGNDSDDAGLAEAGSADFPADERQAMEAVVVQGMVVICMDCRKIRNRNGIWGLPFRFFQTSWKLTLSHGICPDCMEKRS